MANCILQPRHWPATVSRHSGDAAGRCSPSSRRALTAAPPGVRPRPLPAPARDRARRRWRRVPSGATRSSSSRQRTTSAGSIQAGPAARAAAARGLRAGGADSPCRRKCQRTTPGLDAPRHRHNGDGRHAPRRRQRAWQPIGRHGKRAADGSARRDSQYHTGDRGRGDNGRTGRVGRGRADRCLRTRPGGARRSTSLPGARPARDGRRGNAATDHPEHAGVRSVGAVNRPRS